MTTFEKLLLHQNGAGVFMSVEIRGYEFML